tara:strand:+ start:38454 stop:40136 length:1683 start_codon:yes stop_codon:yes gene_type:complete
MSEQAFVENQTPINIDQFTSLADMFEKSCARYGNRTAYINMGQELSFNELEEKSRIFATYLQNKFGIGKGDCVAIMMPNLLQFPIAFYGALRTGARVVNVNPLYTARELKHQLNDAGATTMVIVANFAHVLSSIEKETPVQHVILTEVGDMLSAVKGKIVNFAAKHVKHMVPTFTLENVVQFKQVMKDGKKLTLNKVEIDYEDVALLQYTGGTTGLAKGAVLTHRNLLANLLQMEWCIDIHDGKEVVVTALPLYHIFALTTNCLLFTKTGGTIILITNPRDIPGMVKDISRYPYTVIIAVNTLVNSLLNNKDFTHSDMSNLRVSIGGGMAVQRSVAERWREVTGVRMLMGYGLTEASPVVAVEADNGESFTGTIGLPVASTQVCIQDDDKNIVARNQVGELCVRGPQVMQGYWHQPEETTNVISEDGWLHTGDMAMIEDNDYIRIVDRKKDLIIVAGFNVYPNEVEEVLASMDGVLEVACIGVEDRRSGEMVKAFIVKKPGSDIDKKAVREFSKENLANYKIPRMIEFRESLPKSNVGKILRRELREEETKRQTPSADGE